MISFKHIKLFLFLLLIPFKVLADNSVGTPDANLEITPNGAAAYNLTIDIPNGGSFHPNIGLAYNSQSASYGNAGFGFNITGISVITSGGKDIYHDGEVAGNKGDYKSSFYLDGKRLILVSGINGDHDSKYQIEGDPNTEITLKGGFNDFNINVWFEVRTADGSHYYYGYNNTARLRYYDKDGIQRCSAWYISEAIDKYHNYIKYSYDQNNLCIIPKKIIYGIKDPSYNIKYTRQMSCWIDFEYSNITSNNQKIFYLGKSLGKITKKLSTIKTMINRDPSNQKSGSLYRKYTFAYNDTIDKGYKKYTRLISIVESNEWGDKYNPITINWDGLPAFNVSPKDLGVVTNNYGTNEIGKKFFTIDLNNDGVSEIIRNYLEKRSGSEYNNWVDITFGSKNDDGSVSYFRLGNYKLGICKLNNDGEVVSGVNGYLVGDFDGDGYTDLMIKYYYQKDNQWNQEFYFIPGALDFRNTRRFYATTPYKNYNYKPMSTTLDVDGDGKLDIVSLGTVKNNGSYDVDIIYNSNQKRNFSYTTIQIQLDWEPKNVFTTDCNNDGLADLIILGEKGYKIYYNNGYKGSAENLFSYKNSKSLDSSKDANCLRNFWKLNQGDFNGDGLVDFVCVRDDDTHLWIAYNKGDGIFTCTQSFDMDTKDNSAPGDDNKYSINVYDADHDGLSDVVVCKAEYASHGGIKGIFKPFTYKHTRFIWLRSTGNSFEQKANFIKNREDDAIEGYIFPGDFDGDGYVELANYGSLLNSTSTTFKEHVIHVYKCANNAPSLGKVTSITDALGVKTSLTYSYATTPAVCTNSEKGNYPVLSYITPMVVTSQISTTGSGFAEKKTQFKYGDYRVHIGGRGPLGFASFTKKDLSTGITENTTIEDWDPNYRVATEVINTTTLPDNTKSTTVSKTEVVELGKALSGKISKYFAYPSSTTVTDYDGNVTTTTSTYDTAKGVMTSQKVADDGGKMYKQETYTYPDKKICGAWLPTKTETTQMHSDASSSAQPYSVVTDYTYDQYGNPTTIVTTPNKSESMKITQTYTYDHLGNKKSEVTTVANVKPITKYYYYDDTYRFITCEKTSTASSQISSHIAYKYNIYGDMYEKIDSTVSTNLLVTSYLYDGWDEITKTEYPDQNYVEYSKMWEPTLGAGYYSNTSTPNNGSHTKTIYDPLGREVSTSSVGLKGVAISKKTTYDSKGQVSCVVNKKGKLILSETYTYDNRGRKTKYESSTGASTTYEYDNRSVSKKTVNGTTKTTYDAWGNIKSIEDPLGNYVEYIYNPSGQPSAISTYTNSGTSSSVTFGYDAACHRTTMKDPDAGTMTYKYAADGTLLSQTDARGITTNYSYDDLGRVVQKTYTNNNKSGYKSVQVNEYGTTGYGINRIVKQKYGACNREFKYDRYGRVIQEIRTVVHALIGKKSYTIAYDYNALGQKASVSYPNTLTDLKFNYYYDQNGFLNEIKLNDSQSVYSVNSYDGKELKTNTVAGIMKQTVNDDGYPLEYQLSVNSKVKDILNFTYDKSTGNLLTRCWKNNGYTRFNEAFEYDNMDRLMSVSNNVTHVKTMTMSYADNGNITNKSDVGTYTYNQAGKPHAVTSVSNSSKTIGSNTVWTEFGLNGKIESIDTNGASLFYEYGPDDEKWMTSGWGPNQTCIEDVEHLYFGNYERIIEDDVITEQYFIENGVVVISKTVGKNAPNIKAYQTVTDNLGSILVVYDENQKEVFKAKYDAWGRQSVYKITNGINFQYGYTGHEMLPDFGLIDMGGRLYDPTLGRFLSCDNYVQEPDNSQNFNRYSYCINNPLKYTDPTGELFGIDDVIIWGAVAGAVLGGINAAAKGDNIIGGALIGGVIGGLSSWAGGAVAGLAEANNVWAGALIGAGTGALNGAATTFLQTGLNNLVNGRRFDEELWGAVGSSALSGAISGAIGGGFKAYQKCKKEGLNPWGRTVLEDKEMTFSNDISPYYHNDPYRPMRQASRSRFCYSYAECGALQQMDIDIDPTYLQMAAGFSDGKMDNLGNLSNLKLGLKETKIFRGLPEGRTMSKFVKNFQLHKSAALIGRVSVGHGGHAMTVTGFSAIPRNRWFGKTLDYFKIRNIKVFDPYIGTSRPLVLDKYNHISIFSIMSK